MKRYQQPFGSLLLALSLLLGVGEVRAQVSIGQSTPDTNSVLDLTNPNQRGVVLPPATNSASFSNALTIGMTYFSGNHLHYLESLGYNALTPWKYKFAGNTTEDVYYHTGGRIGVGVANLTLTPDAPLQIATDAPVSLTSHGSLAMGESSGNNVVINTGEIQARQNGSGAPLLLNEEGGDIDVGSVPGPVQFSVTDRVEHLYQPTNTYYELMPPGAIAMWFGATSNIPIGWALCDGGTYTKSDNSGNISTPDLQGMFVVSYGASATSSYAPHDTAGIDLVELTEAQNPSHDHSLSLTTQPGGSHTHGMHGSFYEHDGDGDGGDEGFQTSGNDQTTTSGNHSHNLTGFTQFVGGTPHENRPSFYALVYIMKL